MATDAELRAAIDALTKQVASLEASLAAPLEASHARWAAQLQSRLTTLAASAAAPAAPAPALKTAPVPPPQLTPLYQGAKAAEAAESVASWSADAYGKAKVPGWYHLQRKDLYQRRLQMARDAPKGCYVKHTKYADEAARIQPTDRLAF